MVCCQEWDQIFSPTVRGSMVLVVVRLPLAPLSDATLDVLGNYVFGNDGGNYETTLWPAPNPPPGNPTDDPLLDAATLVPNVCSPVYDTGAGFLISPDFNADEGVDGVDIVNLAVASGSFVSDPRYAPLLDLDSDEDVDGDDLAVMVGEFGNVCIP